MTTTTNTKTDSTASTSTVPSTTTPTASTISAQAGALWTALLKLTALNNDILKDFQDELLKNLDTEIDQGTLSSEETRDAAQAQSDATLMDACASIATAAVSIGALGYSAYKSSDLGDGLNTKMKAGQEELDRLNGLKTQLNGPARGTAMMQDAFNPAPPAAHTEAVNARKTEMQTTHAAFAERTDLDDEAISSMNAGEKRQAKLKLQEQIQYQEGQMSDLKVQKNINLQTSQLIEELSKAGAGLGCGLKKASDQYEQGDHTAKSALENMQSSVAGQTEQALKSAMDKATQSTSSAVEQYRQAISAVYRG